MAGTLELTNSTEVEKAIKSLKDLKMAGTDEITSELSPDSTTQDNNKGLKCPEDCPQSTFVPLHKKGDPTVSANYRRISLIPHASKVRLNIEILKSWPEYKTKSSTKWLRNSRASDLVVERTCVVYV